MLKKLIVLIMFVLSSSLIFTDELKKPLLGEKISIQEKFYDTFYYYEGQPQYLMQKYNMISIPFSVNIHTLNGLKLDGIYLSEIIKDVVKEEGHVKAHKVQIDENDRANWIRIRNLLSKNGIPSWPVVTYHAKDPLILDGMMNIQFYKYTSAEKREDVFKRYGLKVVEISLRDPEFYTVSLPVGTDPFAVANSLVERDFVRWAQPNWFWHHELKSTEPDDTYFGNQWHLTQILAQYAWDTETGAGKDARIAIVDSGVDTTHPDLNVLSGYDFISNDNDPNPDKAQDDHQGVPHGTSCAGLAGAKTNNGFGVAAACWGCPIIPVRLIGSYLYSSTIKDALEYAVDQGAWVVSNSWGPQGKDNYGNCISSPADNNQSSAVDYGRIKGRGGKGTVMLWAAGNDSCNTSFQGFLKDNDMLTISALESSGSMASYSNFGVEIDLSAGAGNYTTDIQGSYGYNYNTGYDGDSLSDLNYTSVFAGTSAATPVAAGAVALMIAANPDLTFSGIMNCAKASAAKTSKSCPKGGWVSQTDPWLASGSKDHSPCFGFGVVDANAMVNGAKNGTCGECVSTSDMDLCWGDGLNRDDDCDGTVDNECSSGGIGKAGDSCEKDLDCKNTSKNPLCIKEEGWTGGYCSAECELNADCYNSINGVECYDGKCIAKCNYNEIRSGYECLSNKILPEGTEVKAVCGNNIIEKGEVCDGDTKDCVLINSGYIGGEAACRTTCKSFDTSTCENGDTGNTGNSGSDTGNTGNTGNTSDTGNTGNTSDTGNTGDTGDTGSSNCGDGVINLGEQCDDGNKISGDGCSAYCLKEKKSSSSGCSAVVL